MSTKVVNETSLRYVYGRNEGDYDENNFWEFSLELVNDAENKRLEVPRMQLFLNMSVPVDNVGLVEQQWDLTLESAMQIRNWLDEVILSTTQQ